VEVFVGEVCIPKYGFVPVFTSSEHKVLDERDISRFSSMLKASGIKGLYVSDGANALLPNVHLHHNRLQWQGRGEAAARPTYRV